MAFTAGEIAGHGGFLELLRQLTIGGGQRHANGEAEAVNPMLLIEISLERARDGETSIGKIGAVANGNGAAWHVPLEVAIAIVERNPVLLVDLAWADPTEIVEPPIEQIADVRHPVILAVHQNGDQVPSVALGGEDIDETCRASPAGLAAIRARVPPQRLVQVLQIVLRVIFRRGDAGSLRA